MHKVGCFDEKKSAYSFNFCFNPAKFAKGPKKIQHGCPVSTRSFVVLMKQGTIIVRTQRKRAGPGEIPCKGAKLRKEYKG